MANGGAGGRAATFTCSDFLACVCGSATPAVSDDQHCKDTRSIIQAYRDQFGNQSADTYCQTLVENSPAGALGMTCMEGGGQSGAGGDGATGGMAGGNQTGTGGVGGGVSQDAGSDGGTEVRDGAIDAQMTGDATQGQVLAIAAGDSHVCELLMDGTVKCWGSNVLGQLGNGGTVDSLHPMPVTGVFGAKALFAGFFDSCAILNDDTVTCWGALNSRLGKPVQVPEVAGARTLAVGDHTCAVLPDQTVKCWGSNDFGQLGDGTTQRSFTPVTVQGIGGASDVAVGGGHTCVLLMDGSVKCWGAGALGQLGNGMIEGSLTPVVVAGLTGVRAISGGGARTCAALADRTVSCWGTRAAGQLGDGIVADGAAANPQPSAVSVQGLTSVQILSAGSITSCALTSEGSIFCWGAGFVGTLGNGTTGSVSAVPVQVVGVTNARSLSTGGSVACALLAARNVVCWGDNFHSELGNNTVLQTGTPVPVL